MSTANLDIRLQVKDDGSVVLEGVSRKLHEVGAQGDKAGRSVDRAMAQADTTIKGMLGSVRSLAGVFGVTLGAGYLVDFGRRMLEAADATAKAAQRAGLATDALQEFRYAGRLAGLTTDELDRSLASLGRRLGEARAGTGEAKQVIEQYGITASDTAVAFRQVSDAVAGARDDAERLYVLSKLFGEEVGARLLPLLSKGSDYLAAMGAEAHAAGQVLDEELVRKAEEINDEFTKMTGKVGTALKGAIVQTVGEVKALYDWLQKINALMPGRGAAETRAIDTLRNRLSSVEGSLPEYRQRLQEARESDAPDLAYWAERVADRQAEANKLRRELAELLRANADLDIAAGGKLPLDRWRYDPTHPDYQEKREPFNPYVWLGADANMPGDIPPWQRDPNYYRGVAPENVERWVARMQEGGDASMPAYDIYAERDRRVEDARRKAYWEQHAVGKDVWQTQAEERLDVESRALDAIIEMEERAADRRAEIWRQGVGLARQTTGEYADLFRQMYEDTGGTSRRYWEAYKAMAVSQSIIAGVEATVEAIRWGTSVGGPYAGAAAGIFIGGLSAMKTALIAKEEPAKSFDQGGIFTGPWRGEIEIGRPAVPEVIAPLEDLKSMLNLPAAGGGGLVVPMHFNFGDVHGMDPGTLALVMSETAKAAHLGVRRALVEDPDMRRAIRSLR